VAWKFVWAGEGGTDKKQNSKQPKDGKNLRSKDMKPK
jgi:hypothetical protein